MAKAFIRRRSEAKKEAAMKPESTDTKKKSLLIPTDNFLPRWDGIARFLSEIIPRLKDKYSITVIAPDFGPYDAGWGESVRIVKIPVLKLKVGDFNPARIEYTIIKREVKKADIVFSQTIGTIGYLAIRAAKKSRKRIISFIHSIEWELVAKAAGFYLLRKYTYKITKSLARRIYSKPDLLIVPSDNIAEMLAWQKIKTRKKVIHLGVDTKKFMPASDKAEAKKKLGLDPDIFLIGNHGRLGREKDLFTLLRAFVAVKRNCPNAVLIVVGSGVESIKRKLESVKGVILPGSTSNVVPYLQAMDVYCLPSLTETTSLATLEAMACGVPVIATPVGFVKDYLKHMANGLLFKEKNSYDLARQIEMLIRHPDLRKRIGNEARRTVEREFSWDKTAKDIEEAIESMIAGSG
ncbi:glycosyltransferase family 4 protein [Candidatus Woesearchaeota archaeon]|nr:glycosyltransferase family 4 protein [Candidatus Woesearchaeota archaeon]